MKQIPNIVTLLNLVFGCLAIVACIQNGLTIGLDPNSGQQIIVLPEKLYMASIFIGIAAIIDFLDGFVARLFSATSGLGKQLDSLADVVSFGVAPGMIVFQFLRLAYAKQEDGLDINTIWLLPAFIIPSAGAFRLGRFNLDTNSSKIFKGVPIPAVGLFIASFPFVYWFNTNSLIESVLLNKWFWYAVIIAVSFLMVSTIPMLALKFDGFSFKKLLPFIIIALVAIASGLLLGWLAVSLSFISYIIVSFVFKKSSI